MPEPYAFSVDGRQVQDVNARYVNIHVINTVGVEAVKQCIECW